MIPRIVKVFSPPHSYFLIFQWDDNISISINNPMSPSIFADSYLIKELTILKIWHYIIIMAVGFKNSFSFYVTYTSIPISRVDTILEVCTNLFSIPITYRNRMIILCYGDYTFSSLRIHTFSHALFIHFYPKVSRYF